MLNVRHAARSLVFLERIPFREPASHDSQVSNCLGGQDRVRLTATLRHASRSLGGATLLPGGRSTHALETILATRHQPPSRSMRGFGPNKEQGSPSTARIGHLTVQ